MGTYTYGANANGTGAGPHQARVVAGGAYSYDANGNLTSGGSRTYTWDGGNLVSSVNASEFYLYDADGERVLRRTSSATTVYFQGMWENVVGGATKRYYTFNGQTIAVRDSGAAGLSYLHSDHLGSASLATNGTGTALLSQQEFTPWGSVRTGGVSQTSLNFTGQRLDSTGLLYYHARYYDPVLARFVSADTVVPSAEVLTIGPAKQSNGPTSPQELNRYSYVNNNPVRYIDPTGHCGTSGFMATAISVMIGDCYNRARIAYNKSQTTEQKLISGGVQVAAGVAGVLGWVGGTILAITGASAAIGAITSGSATVVAAETGGVATATASKIDPNKLNHIFGKAEHMLDDFVSGQGGQEQAFRAIQDAANQAFRDGKLVPGPNGVLPNGNAGPIIDVAGTQIRLIGGRIVDGVVQIATASRKGL